MRRLPRWLRLTGYILGFLLVIAVLIVVVPPYRSLPLLGGRDTIPTLQRVVAVQRDRRGVVTLQAEGGRRDIARATGYVHAQERFFQMDLMRRIAAGELAELFGPQALPIDRSHRLHQLRAVVARAKEQLPADQRDLIEDYTVGVNAGLEALAESPFEYVVLRTKPRPWTPDDCLLVCAAMAFDLQDTVGDADRARGTIRETFTPEVAEFLLSEADAFEAPLDDSTIPLPEVPATPALNQVANAAVGPILPGKTAPHAASPASEFAETSRDALRPDSFLAQLLAAYLPSRYGQEDLVSGSNVWAVSGKRAQGVTGILANDPHLGLRMPNTWFRMQFTWVRPDKKKRTITGATLPGLPAIVIGSNGDVAWGLTNSYIDTTDVVIVETDPANPKRYRTPDGWKDFEVDQETLKVKGGPEQGYNVTRTIWGPVIARDAAKRPLVLHWAMHSPDSYNLTFMGLEEVASVRGALAFAKTSGMPHHNFVCTDRDGDIAWTIAGRIPRRIGTDGRTPASWADGSVRWDGWVPTPQHPQMVNPPEGIIWSANARQLGGEALAILGNGRYDFGSRAKQIRDRLRAKPEFTAADLWDIQFDDRALYLERWQQLLVATLASDATASSPARAELKQLVEKWGGRAVPESAGYRFVRDFREQLKTRIEEQVLAPCSARDRTFDSSNLRFEEQWFALASQQPAGWMPDGKAGWTKLLRDTVDTIIADAGGAGKLAEHTWGKSNRLAMRHPMSRSIPGGKFLLDLGGEEMAGDSGVVCAQTSAHGPSLRMVVMPGREAESFFHMPGGQSGNPLSSHYSDSHSAWLEREATPFLPGKIDTVLALYPVSKD